MDKSLYQISLEVKELFDKIEENQGEILEDYDNVNNALSIMLQTKTDSVCDYIRYINDLIVLMDSRIKELKTAKESLEKKLEKFNDYIVNCMAIMGGVKELNGNINRIVIRKPSQSVKITDIDSIPLSLISIKEIIEKNPDKIAIKKMIQLGELVSGAELVEGKQKAEIKARSK